MLAVCNRARVRLLPHGGAERATSATLSHAALSAPTVLPSTGAIGAPMAPLTAPREAAPAHVSPGQRGRQAAPLRATQLPSAWPRATSTATTGSHPAP